MRISPELGRSSPPMRFKRVDFPEPEGPTIDTTCPFAISRSMLSSAVALRFPSNTFETWWSAIILCDDSRPRSTAQEHKRHKKHKKKRFVSSCASCAACVPVPPGTNHCYHSKATVWFRDWRRLSVSELHTVRRLPEETCPGIRSHQAAGNGQEL